MRSATNSLKHSLLSSLGQLDKLLTFTENNEKLLEAQLSQDMLPMATQFKVCCNFIGRIVANITQSEFVSLEPTTSDMSALRSHIAATKTLLQDAEFDDSTWLNVNQDENDKLFGKDQAGDATIELPIEQYVMQFALPNYYFHLSMIYAILRHQGIKVSKGDYDGLHQYRPGFSFI